MPGLSLGAGMNRDETVALFLHGREAWNAWAERMLTGRKALEEAGRWAAEKGQGGGLEAKSEETRAWMENAKAAFTGCLFLVKGAEGAKEAAGEDKEESGEAGLPVKSIQLEGHTADFSGFIFPGFAWFESATFAGDASFDSATFTGDLSFINVTFSRDAWFKSTTFGGNASFGSATITRDAWFNSATFSGDVSFSAVTFSRDAKFENATFRGGAWFANATFNATFTGCAWFESATFTGNAFFERATFTGGAWFKSASFSGSALFDSATFAGDARFASATFSGDARFDSATFSGDARFKSATFTGDARFESATFTGDARFDSATFPNYTNFAEAKFLQEANFTGIKVERAFDMTGAAFTEVPAFNQADFKQAPDLDDVRFPLPGFWRGGKAKLVAKYRAIRRMAIQGADYEREQMAYKGELRSRRWTVDKFWHPGLWLGLFYDGVADCGRSMVPAGGRLARQHCGIRGVLLAARGGGYRNTLRGGRRRGRTGAVSLSEERAGDLRRHARRAGEPGLSLPL